MKAIQIWVNDFPAYEAAHNFIEDLHQQVAKLKVRQSILDGILHDDLCNAFDKYAEEAWVTTYKIARYEKFLQAYVENGYSHREFLQSLCSYLNDMANFNASSSNPLYTMKMNWKYAAIMEMKNQIEGMFERACEA
jgi:hypothetical protein